MGSTTSTTCCPHDWCAVTCTAELIGRKWHPVIVHRLLHAGPMGFVELREAVSGLSDKVLTEHLEALVEAELVDRRVVQPSPRRVRYDLTPAGRDLRPVIEAMEAWGQRHLC